MEEILQGPAQSPWWKGARGEWWVIAQAFLAVLVVFGPRTCEGWTAWVQPYSEISAIAGVTLFLIGGLLFAAGVFKLGPNFTPVPFPKPEATLVETGPYGFVRHPMYSGAVLMASGVTVAPQDLMLRGAREGQGKLEDMSLEEVESFLIQKTLARFGGNVSRAAEALGLSRSALYRRLERYGL